MLPGVFDLSPLSRAEDRHDNHDVFAATARLAGHRHESGINRRPGVSHALV
jgi:hypothetical protein